MSNICQLFFSGSDFERITLRCHDPLLECLTVQNSPVLFGCRTGICDTCLVEVCGDVEIFSIETSE